MSKIFALYQHVETGYRRLFELYQNGDTSPALSDMLSVALKELGIVCEQLQIALKELNHQTQQIRDAQIGLQTQQCLHQHLFQLSPDSYLIIDRAGVIQAVNAAAATLLNTTQSLLLGKSLFSLVADSDYEVLREKIAELTYHPRVDCSIALHRHPDQLFNVTMSLAAMAEPQGGLLVCCSLQAKMPEKQSSTSLEHYIHDNLEECSLYHFNRGEIISLEPNTLWFITQGVVKLTTLAGRGEEILVGIAGPSMVFGSSLTNLLIYQAIALSKVKLAPIAVDEVAQSPQLTQSLLTAIGERLRQAEGFLSIHGQLRVEDRLKQLLLLLKQFFGQPADTGTRLNLRLTHQDLASACCTTRVTITRLLNKLQQEKLLEIDSQNHLIISDALCL